MSEKVKLGSLFSDVKFILNGNEYITTHFTLDEENLRMCIKIGFFFNKKCWLYSNDLVEIV